MHSRVSSDMPSCMYMLWESYDTRCRMKQVYYEAEDVLVD